MTFVLVGTYFDNVSLQWLVTDQFCTGAVWSDERAYDLLRDPLTTNITSFMLNDAHRILPISLNELYFKKRTLYLHLGCVQS